MATIRVSRLWLIITVALLMALGISGLAGGVLLLAFPDGSPLGVTPDALENVPIDGYRMPGAILVAVFGVPSFAAAILVLERHLLGWMLALALGLALTGLIVLEFVLMEELILVVQLPFLALGVALMGFGALGWIRTERGTVH